MNPLKLARVILFTPNLERLSTFYRDVLGLKELSGTATAGWMEFYAGGGVVALHRGKSKPGSTKLAFLSRDVPRTREELIAKGARMGKVKGHGDLTLCEGLDPEGNPFQISSRD